MTIAKSASLASYCLNGGMPDTSQDRTVWRQDRDESMQQQSLALRTWAFRNALDVPNVALRGLRVVEDPNGKRWVVYDRLLGTAGARFDEGPDPANPGKRLSACERMRVPLVVPPPALLVSDAVERLGAIQ